MAAAQCSLGFSYEMGRGVPQTLSKAAKWFRKAADQDYTNAQFNLGVFYEQGLGVPQSDAEAAKWYRKAADLGDVSAQSNLGVFYNQGRGVPKSDTEAAEWLRKAADLGDAGAQCNLGVFYRTGAWCAPVRHRGRKVVPEGGGPGPRKGAGVPPYVFCRGARHSWASSHRHCRSRSRHSNCRV